MSQSDEEGFHRSSIEMLTIKNRHFHEAKQTKFMNKNANHYRSPLSLHHQLMLYEYPKCLDYFNQPKQFPIHLDAHPNFNSLVENDRQNAVLLSEFFSNRLNCVFNRFGENLMLKRDTTILIRNIINRIRNDQTTTFRQRMPSPPSSVTLRFSSNFQGGNLHCVYRDRKAGIYYLLLQNDINTHGYNLWFHFNIKANQAASYHFVIANFTKEIKFANQILLLTFSSKNHQYTRQIPFKCQETKFRHCESLKRFWCIKFSYCFEAGQDVYISLSPPYSFSKLLRLFKQVSQPFYQSITLKTEIAGRSQLGNFIQCLKVGSKDRPSKECILITARQHPCQTMGSLVCEEIIKILTESTPLAHQLTDAFTFYIIPMINPDGVIHGNSRTNLIGYDINRTWDLGPTQTTEAVKIWEYIGKITEEGNEIAWSFDLHGHSKELGYFCYFCQQNQNTLMLHHFLSEQNIYKAQQCGFSLNKSKRESIRGQLFCKLNVVNAVTVQTSYYGYIDQHGKLIQYNQSHYNAIASKLLQSLSQILKINKNMSLKEELLHKISPPSRGEKKISIYNYRLIDSDSDPEQDYLLKDERKQIREQHILKANTKIRTRTEYHARGRSSVEETIYKDKKDSSIKNIRSGSSSFHQNANIEKEKEKSLTFYDGRRTISPTLKKSFEKPNLRRKIEIHPRENCELSPTHDDWLDKEYFKKSFELRRILREQEQSKRLKTHVGGFRTCYQVLGLKTIVYPTATSAGIDFQNNLKTKKDIIREIRGKQLRKGMHKRKLSQAYGSQLKKKS